MTATNPLGTETFWVNAYHVGDSVSLGAVWWSSRDNAAFPPDCDLAYRLKVRPWIPHDGGPCPVDSDVLLRVRTRDGQTTGKRFAFSFHSFLLGLIPARWKHTGGPHDIIAYQIIED